MSNPVGGSLVTADGINAILNANATGTKIKPKFFRFSNQDKTLDPNLSAGDIVAWRTQDISQYRIVDDKTVEFVCDVAPDEATDYARFCGIYLEDGTLFAVAKPPFPFPPQLRQTLKVQISYSQIDKVMDFQYVSNDETEQWGAILDTVIHAFRNNYVTLNRNPKVTKIQGVNV